MSIPQRARPAPVGRRKPNGTTLTDRIRQAVQRDIVAGKLRPGAKLDEDSLAARHGASRTRRALCASICPFSDTSILIAPHSPVAQSLTPASRYRCFTSGRGKPKRLPAPVEAIATMGETAWMKAGVEDDLLP